MSIAAEWAQKDENYRTEVNKTRPVCQGGSAGTLARIVPHWHRGLASVEITGAVGTMSNGMRNLDKVVIDDLADARRIARWILDITDTSDDGEATPWPLGWDEK